MEEEEKMDGWIAGYYELEWSDIQNKSINFLLCSFEGDFLEARNLGFFKWFASFGIELIRLVGIIRC